MEVVMPTTTQPYHRSAVALRGRMGRGAIVLGAHIAVIYGVAASLGIVRSPVAVEPMQAVLITETEHVEPEPFEPLKPELATPQVAEVVLPDPVVEMPLEEAPAPENAITMDPTPPAPPSMNLAVAHSTQPAYPPMSRRMNEEGVVALAVLVDERGRPAEVRVEHSSGFPRLDQAAVEGLRKWRFQAAVRDGVATRAWTTVRVRFRLDA
jgi:protein TonB